MGESTKFSTQLGPPRMSSAIFQSTQPTAQLFKS